MNPKTTLIMKNILLLLAVLAFASATPLSAQLKMGYVDPTYVLSKMPEMASVQVKLQNFQERKAEELRASELSFREEIQNYQQKEAVLTDDAKNNEQQRLANLERTLQQQQQQAQQELGQKQQELIGPLLSAIQDAINAVAEEMELTYVLNTTTSNGDVIILYASEDAQSKYDITDVVLKKLGI